MIRALLGLCLALGLVTQTEATQVEILGVSADTPVLGVAEVVVRVPAETGVESVELRLDGRAVGRLARPPYRFEVDTGERGETHVFEAIVRLGSGAELSARLTTPRLVIHEAIEAELQQLYATVTDRQGRRVVGFDTADFTVVDQGRRQTLVTLESGEIPFTAMLLLDGSESMRGGKLEAAREGAVAFVEGMKPLDEAALLVVSDRLLAASPAGTDPTALEQVLAEVVPSGGTALHDFLFLALRAVERRQGRRVVALLSDGEDIHSALDMEQVRAVARRSQAQLFWVRLRLAQRPSTRQSAAARPEKQAFRSVRSVQEEVNSWRDPAAMRRQLRELERTVEESGGRIFDVARTEEVAATFREILAELREQVAIGYYPSENRDDGSWHEVTVEVIRPGLEVRTRAGYLDF